MLSLQPILTPERTASEHSRSPINVGRAPADFMRSQSQDSLQATNSSLHQNQSISGTEHAPNESDMRMQENVLPTFPHMFDSNSRNQLSALNDFSLGDTQNNNISFMEPSFNQEYSTWLLEDDFDLNIFNLMAPAATPHDIQMLAYYPTSLGAQPSGRPAPRNSSREVNDRPSIQDLRKLWYTQMVDAEEDSHPVSGTVTPGRGNIPDREDIDEPYRVSLASKLRPRWRDEPLPSSDFLVSGEPNVSQHNRLTMIESLYSNVLHTVQ